MIVGLVVPEIYGRNEAFLPESPLNRDNCLLHLHLLKDELQKLGLTLMTYDMVDPSTAVSYVFLDYNKACLDKLKKKGYKGKKFLVLFESEVVLGRNWIEANHKYFDAVFTWSPVLASRQLIRTRYIQYFWPNDLSVKPEFLPFESRSGFCVVMAGNKWSGHPLELYSERLKTIDWFFIHHPEQLDLYGPGWEPSRWKKIKEKVRDIRRWAEGRPIRMLRPGNYPFYRGVAISKRKILRNYRFCICYENAKDIPGYITEKIFDCFKAGTVPIYWGWQGISSLIPPGAFIDRRKFESHKELYSFISNISHIEYGHYIAEIRDFLASESARKFEAQTFVKILIEGMGLNIPKNRGGGAL